MVHFIEKGDIFAIDDVYSYAHGCNCAGAMGKGIALQFRDLYPDMYLEYKKLYKENKFNPGDVFDYNYGMGHIYNLGTQQSWRTNAQINYIQDSLVNMFDLAVLEKVEKIAMPAIGAGLGGLDWGVVKEVIETVASHYSDVLLVVVEKYSKE